MKRLIILTLSVLFLFPVLSSAQTRTVEGQATGRYYNAVWKKWTDYPVVVYVDNEGNTYIMGGESLIMARGILYPKEREKAVALLKKSKEWASLAKQDKTEITKELGSFLKGNNFKKNGVTLTFFSANAGQQTDVILFLQDFENMFKKIELYLNETQVEQLIKLLEKASDMIKELKEHEKKSQKFK